MADHSPWLRHHDLLLRRAERLLRDPRVALRCSPEDLVQETFLRLTAREPSFRGSTEPERAAFALSVQENLALDLFRTHRDAQRRSVSLEIRERELQNFHRALEDSVAGLAALLPADQTSVSQRAARNELDARMTKAIAELPARERLAISLKRDGQPLSEIADRMGESPDAIGGLLYRGMARLRAKLNPGGHE